MTDYTKQLEERNEQLQEKLIVAESALNALKLYERKQSFFQYYINARKESNEWALWNVSMVKSDIFNSFVTFKHTLLEYNEIKISCQRLYKDYSDHVNILNYRWTFDNAWVIEIEKNKKNKWIIKDFSTYCGWVFDDPTKMQGKSFDKYLSRWRKENE